MRTDDVREDGDTVQIRLCARDRAQAFLASRRAENDSPPGYAWISTQIESYRPRKGGHSGGKMRRLYVTFQWTGKPDVHKRIVDWQVWDRVMAQAERIAKGR